MLDYFSVDLEGGINRHETADDAKGACEEQLDHARDEAVEGWPEETDELCWGVVIEDAHVVSRKRAPEGSEFEDIVEYALRPCSDPTELDSLRVEAKKWRTRSFEALELLAQAVQERNATVSVLRSVEWKGVRTFRGEEYWPCCPECRTAVLYDGNKLLSRHKFNCKLNAAINAATNVAPAPQRETSHAS